MDATLTQHAQTWTTLGVQAGRVVRLIRPERHDPQSAEAKPTAVKIEQISDPDGQATALVVFLAAAEPSDPNRPTHDR